MLLPLLIFHLVAVSIANPFQKYPFVFLLDVGNEELEKTNTEQIRISIPGGSLAVRYPAIGDGDIITHMRVSSIDFGSELKANIIDGGPGYKYVVIVFIGKIGVPYDAVLTIQTTPVSAEPTISKTLNFNVNSDISSPLSSDEIIENNSAEETEDDTETVKFTKNGGELVQSSSNIYKHKQDIEEDDEDTENEVDSSDEKDIYTFKENGDQYRSQSLKNEKYNNDNDENDEDNDKDDQEDNDDDNDNDESDVEDEEKKYPYTEKLQVGPSKIYSSSNNYRNENFELSSINSKDQTISLDKDTKMYRQEALYDAKGKGKVYSPEDPLELDQMFNDEEIHNDAEKYKDSNNNNYVSDFDPAVAYS